MEQRSAALKLSIMESPTSAMTLPARTDRNLAASNLGGRRKGKERKRGANRRRGEDNRQRRKSR